MTGPVPGHPDFQDQTLWRGRTLFFATVNMNNLQYVTLVQGAALNFAGLDISVNGLNGFGSIVVQSTDDPTFNTITDRFAIDVPPGTFNIRVPIQSTYYTARIGNNGTGAPTAATVYVGATNNVLDQPRIWSSNNYIETGTVIIAAGATRTFQLPAPAPGLAQFHAIQATPGAAVYAQVFRYINDGTIGPNVCRINPVSIGAPVSIVLPPAPIGLSVVNTTAGNQTFEASLYPAQVM